MHMVGNLVMAMLVKYWIYICGGMFFFVSFEGRIVMYKIIYMMLFLFCVALYQVSSIKHSERMPKVNIQGGSLLLCLISVWFIALWWIIRCVQDHCRIIPFQGSTHAMVIFARIHFSGVFFSWQCRIKHLPKLSVLILEAQWVVMVAALFTQVHYEWWRRILKYFWMSVVMYTMLVLTLIYTCQFDNSINVWSNMTGMSEEKWVYHL